MTFLRRRKKDEKMNGSAQPYFSCSRKNTAGQSLLIAILSLGGVILGATTIAGLLTVYQIKATTDTQSSAKSLFAADSGVEWALFDYYCDATSSVNPSSRCTTPPREQALPLMGNGSSLSVTCYDASSTPLAVCNPVGASPVTAITVGGARNTKRAFSLTLTSATSTLP